MNPQKQHRSVKIIYFEQTCNRTWSQRAQGLQRLKQAQVRGTTNPAPCCHLANDTDLLMPVLWEMAGDNKLTFDPPTRLSKLTQNLIRSSHGHSTPSLKISCNSVQTFSRNVADEETKRERNRPKTIPRPATGGGVITLCHITCNKFTVYRMIPTSSFTLGYFFGDSSVHCTDLRSDRMSLALLFTHIKLWI